MYVVIIIITIKPYIVVDTHKRFWSLSVKYINWVIILKPFERTKNRYRLVSYILNVRVFLIFFILNHINTKFDNWQADLNTNTLIRYWSEMSKKKDKIARNDATKKTAKRNLRLQINQTLKEIFIKSSRWILKVLKNRLKSR